MHHRPVRLEADPSHFEPPPRPVLRGAPLPWASSGSGRLPRRRGLGDPGQIVAVAGFAVAAGIGEQEIAIYKTFIIGDFLRARDLLTLAPLENFDIFAGFEKALVGSRVEPGEAAAHDLNGELSALHIDPVEIGDFEFTARRRL
jgi:hypothetical protein